MFNHLLMFTYGDTSHNLLGIAIYIKVTVHVWGSEIVFLRYEFVERLTNIGSISKVTHA